jgi:Suppressor of fused protein (SUFU)
LTRVEDTDRFAGLAEHVERYLGPRRDAQAADGFSVVLHDHPTLGMVTAATDGVRLRPLPSALPLEFACSVRPGQDDAAARLVRIFAERAVWDGAEVEYDDGLLTEEPLVPGTRVHGLLAAPHPVADEMFNLFRNTRGELQLQFVTLVPITGAEADYLRDHDTGDLFERWAAEGTDVLDLHRP